MTSSPPSESKRRRKDDQIEDIPNESSHPQKYPLVVFAHGAGANSSSEWMKRWKDMMGKALLAVDVVTFDYPCNIAEIYVNEHLADLSGGKKGAPPKAEKLVDYHLGIVKEAAAKYPGHPLILAGKSMGSRVSCMVAAKGDINISAVICLGYPLKGSNASKREETLLQLPVPAIFVQGSKDALCSLDKLTAVCSKMETVSEVHVVEGGDHSFKIGKKHLNLIGSTQEAAEEEAVKSITKFVRKVLGEL
ncbi:KAT8 regulatory NSL complex subunit 3-like isoform X1 [Papaver somniferum]|nr:KAT8 regulatory NSL complex subunit 3-like isoform X1 [Papaver somniferum]